MWRATGWTRLGTIYCYGTMLSFKYNSYRVAEADTDALRRDERPFAVVLLAAALMLEAGSDPNDREKYARELLSLMTERNYDKRRKKALLNFVRRVLRIQDDDMSQSIKEEWMMRAIPIEEVAEMVWMRQVRDEGREEGIEKGREEGMGKGKYEIAQRMLARKMPISDIVDMTGLSESEILQI